AHGSSLGVELTPAMVRGLARRFDTAGNGQINYREVLFAVVGHARLQQRMKRGTQHIADSPHCRSTYLTCWLRCCSGDGQYSGCLPAV
ncbi:MAG: hypothetical protein ACK4ZJ_17200, partial [Allorhizobium sp.]